MIQIFKASIFKSKLKVTLSDPTPVQVEDGHDAKYQTY